MNLATALLSFILQQSTRQAVPLPPGPQAIQVLPVCATSIRDQANPASCLSASSVPTAGVLFPGPHLGGVNNVQSGTNSFVGGGQSNQATNGAGMGHTTVGGGQENIASGNWATVGGGYQNTASGRFATVGGGEDNRATATWATVGGGGSNFVAGDYATIAGGYSCRSSGQYSTVGGGAYNYAEAESATIAGGYNGEAEGYASTICGGNRNRALGEHSTVAGGQENVALADFSFAAGRYAMANHQGSFVWGDSGTVATKASSAANQFNVYASGGARIFSNGTATSGVLLAPGGGSWSSVSDRNAKENLEAVDGRAILDLVSAMPIFTWNYKTQAESVRHMGPMAQDFHAAFELGVSEKLIDTIDPDGVALAAIQGLNTVLEEKEREIAALRESRAELEARVARLEGLVEGLERAGVR